jgi:hypothetical protein
MKTIRPERFWWRPQYGLIRIRRMHPEAPKRQLRNYQSAIDLELGMLLHFGPKARYHRIPAPQRIRISPDVSG